MDFCDGVELGRATRILALPRPNREAILFVWNATELKIGNSLAEEIPMPSQTELRKPDHRQDHHCPGRKCPPVAQAVGFSRKHGRPSNVATNRPYSGINPLLLDLHSTEQGSEPLVGNLSSMAADRCQVMRRPVCVAQGNWDAESSSSRGSRRMSLTPAPATSRKRKFQFCEASPSSTAIRS